MRGDRDDVFSRGFICPKAHGLKELHEDPDRLTTPLVRRDGELREATWDEAFEEIDRRLSPILETHGRNALAVYVGNPSAHNLSYLTYGPVLLRALGTQNVFTASTVDQMPKQVVRRAHVRPPAERAGAGPRPLRPPADARREPAGVERQPAHGAQHARPAARHPRARRQGRGGGPAAHPHRRGGRRAPLHPARRRRPAARRDGLHARRGVARGPGPARGARGGPRRGLRARARLPPRGRGAGHGHRRRGDPPDGARARRGRARRRLRAHRDHHPGVRHARQLAGGRAQRAHRQPRPRGRGHVHPGGRGPAQLERHARQRPRRSARALAEPRARARRGLRRAARGVPGRGDRHARRGPGPGAAHRRGQPRGVHAEQRPARAGGRAARLRARRWTST